MPTTSKTKMIECGCVCLRSHFFLGSGSATAEVNSRWIDINMDDGVLVSDASPGWDGDQTVTQLESFFDNDSTIQYSADDSAPEYPVSVNEALVQQVTLSFHRYSTYPLDRMSEMGKTKRGEPQEAQASRGQSLIRISNVGSGVKAIGSDCGSTALNCGRESNERSCHHMSLPFAEDSPKFQFRAKTRFDNKPSKIPSFSPNMISGAACVSVDAIADDTEGGRIPRFTKRYKELSRRIAECEKKFQSLCNSVPCDKDSILASLHSGALCFSPFKE